MGSADRPEPGTGDLSTDDLARTQRAPRAEAEEAPAEVPPTLPGEATDTRTPTEGEGRAFPLDEGRDARIGEEPDQPLLGAEEEEEFRSRWHRIQSDFVDEPRASVGEADALVADVIQALATTFADHKHGLEEQWRQGEEVATEDLRVALRRYRSFFNRLLST